MGGCRRLVIATCIICMVFSLRGRHGALDGQPFAFSCCELREFSELERPKQVTNFTVLFRVYITG